MHFRLAIIMAFVPFLAGTALGDCYTGRTETWSDIGTSTDLADALSAVCNAAGVGNTNFTQGGAMARCVPVNRHSFVYQLYNLTSDPVIDSFIFSQQDCVSLGLGAIQECEFGGIFNLTVGGVSVGEAQTVSGTVHAEPLAGTECD